MKMHEQAEIGGPFSNLPDLQALSYFSGPRVEALLGIVDDAVAIAWGEHERKTSCTAQKISTI